MISKSSPDWIEKVSGITLFLIAKEGLSTLKYASVIVLTCM